MDKIYSWLVAMSTTVITTVALPVRVLTILYKLYLILTHEVFMDNCKKIIFPELVRHVSYLLCPISFEKYSYSLDHWLF